MAIGAGKYDPECTEVFEKTKAEAVLLIVIKGDRGSGFSATAYRDVSTVIPEMLREMANQIERDV